MITVRTLVDKWKSNISRLYAQSENSTGVPIRSQQKHVNPEQTEANSVAFCVSRLPLHGSLIAFARFVDCSCPHPAAFCSLLTRHRSRWSPRCLYCVNLRSSSHTSNLSEITKVVLQLKQQTIGDTCNVKITISVPLIMLK